MLKKACYLILPLMFLSPLYAFAQSFPAAKSVRFQISGVEAFEFGQAEGNSLEEATEKWWQNRLKYFELNHWHYNCNHTSATRISTSLLPNQSLNGSYPSVIGYVAGNESDDPDADYCGGSATIVDLSYYECPNGYRITPAPNTGAGFGLCTPDYVVTLIEENQSTQCSVGNPVDVVTGSKIQREIDIAANGTGQIFYERYYNSKAVAGTTQWHNNYDYMLDSIDANSPQQIQQKSSFPSDSKEMACLYGFDEMSQDPSNNKWTQGNSAKFDGNTCSVINSKGTVVRTLSLIPAGVSSVSNIPSAVRIRQPDGSTMLFQLYADPKTYSSTSGDKGKLEQLESNVAKWRYTSTNGEVKEFSSQGKLLSILATNGAKQSLSYDPITGLLSRVTDSTGRYLQFTYLNSQLASITTNGNKTYTYTYNNNLIVDVKRPNNTHRLYHYEDSRFPSALTGITDEKNIRYATWSYDAQGRAISSEHAGGAEKTSIRFDNETTTTTTNELGKKTIYHYEYIAGARRVTSVEGQPTSNCVGANQNYTYTKEGWLASKTDWKGNLTTFHYDSMGRETSRTEGFGTPEARTTTTEWDQTLNRIKSISTDESETTFTYDSNGLLLKKSVRSLTTP